MSNTVQESISQQTLAKGTRSSDSLSAASSLDRQTSVSEATDEELVTWAQAGATAALGELLRRNHERIYAVARHYTLSHEDADDLVQETMLRAIRNLQRFRGEARFSSWLTAIAINAALSEKRKKRNIRWISIEENPVHDGIVKPTVLPEHRPNPEQIYMREELRSMLWRGMGQIVPSQRQLLQISYFDETPVKDTAAQLGIALGTAKSRLRRARLQLARELKRRNRFPLSSPALSASPVRLVESEKS